MPIVCSEDADPEVREELEQLMAERRARQEEIEAILAPLHENDGEAEPEGGED
jgi:hypothetical protein